MDSLAVILDLLWFLTDQKYRLCGIVNTDNVTILIHLFTDTADTIKHADS